MCSVFGLLLFSPSSGDCVSYLLAALAQEMSGSGCSFLSSQSSFPFHLCEYPLVTELSHPVFLGGIPERVETAGGLVCFSCCVYFRVNKSQLKNG